MGLGGEERCGVGWGGTLEGQVRRGRRGGWEGGMQHNTSCAVGPCREWEGKGGWHWLEDQLRSGMSLQGKKRTGTDPTVGSDFGGVRMSCEIPT